MGHQSESGSGVVGALTQPDATQPARVASYRRRCLAGVNPPHGRNNLAARFQAMGEQLQTHHDTDDEYFEHATTALVRLFARVNPLDGRTSVFP